MKVSWDHYSLVLCHNLCMSIFRWHFYDSCMCNQLSYCVECRRGGFIVYMVRGSRYQYWYMIYLLTAIELTPGGSSIIHIYTQTIHRCAYIRMKCSQDKFVLKFGSHNILTIKIYFFPPPMKYHKWTLTNVIWKQHLLFAI